MSAGSLRFTVVVRHPETSEPVALVAGEPVPGWATDLVHPDDIEGAEPEAKRPAKRAASKPSAK